jgi:cell division control protein 6
MTDYLDRIGAGKILISKEPFSFDWTPPCLVGREKELMEIASIFIGIDNPNVSARATIMGPVGSGKTVLAKRFSDDLIKKLEGRRKIVSIHINCRNYSRTSQVLHQIAMKLDPRHPERGFSAGEIIHTVRRNLNSHNIHLILILDEVDVLIRKDSSDLIYRLLRIDEGQNDKGYLSLILISQELSLMNRFEAAIISRLGMTNVLKLEPYGENQLIGIAKQRALLACKSGSISEDILSKIGRYSAVSGDARMCIELLEGGIRRAEMNGMDEVRIEDIEPSQFRESSVEPSQIDALLEHQKLVLLGICRRLKKKDNLFSGDAKKLYILVCEEYGVKAKGHTTFLKYLKSLEIEGLIDTKTVNSITGRGRTQNITMSNSSPAELENRIEKVLSRY